MKTSKEINEILEEIIEKIDRIKLDIDVCVCDCGLPYKESNPADLINDLSINIRQTLLEFQREVREETLRAVLPEKINIDIAGITDDENCYEEPKDVWNECINEIISTAKEKYGIEL